MEKILDGLIQKWACKQQSQVSRKKAECGHHLIRRKNELTKWNIENIMPLTKKEHYDIHTNGLDYRNEKQKKYCLDKEWISFRDYLLQNGLTEEEFQEKKLRELYEILEEPYDEEKIRKIIDKISKTKSSQDEYKKKAQEKSNEIRRKLWKESYRKQKEWKNNLKKS